MTAITVGSFSRARGVVTPSVRSAGDEVVRGRDAEQKIVRDLLRRAQRGAGGVVLVEGEPGIGKSRLLRDSTDVAAEQGFSLAVGAADQLGRAIPFFALRTALREPFAEPTANGHDRDLRDAPAWWISRMQAHLEKRAAPAPVLACLDDLQWANPDTLAAHASNSPASSSSKLTNPTMANPPEAGKRLQPRRGRRLQGPPEGRSRLATRRRRVNCARRTRPQPALKWREHVPASALVSGVADAGRPGGTDRRRPARKARACRSTASACFDEAPGA